MKTDHLLRQILSRWDAWWFTPFPYKCFQFFRIAHGATLLLFLLAWWCHASEWLTTSGFHAPDELVPPLAPAALPLFAVLQFGALLLFILGRQTRLMAAISWGCLFYVTMVDRVSAYSINNIFLFTFAILSVFRTSSKQGTIEIAPVRLLQLGMVMIYFSSGWHKGVYGDWLDSPYVLEASIKGIYMTDFAAWALRTMPAYVWTIVQYTVLAFELFSPVLFFSKWRNYAIVAGCVFHLGIALFMDQLIYFSLQMMSFYILFYTPLNERKRANSLLFTAINEILSRFINCFGIPRNRSAD